MKIYKCLKRGVNTKLPPPPIESNFWTFLDFDTKPDFWVFFVHLETYLAFKKAINLPYWGPILNIRIFVRLKTKNFFWPNFKFVPWGPKGSFQQVHRAPSREPEVIPLLWGHRPQSRGPAEPPSPPQEREGRAQRALNF